MNNIKIAKQLVKLAKSLMAEDEEKQTMWQVWALDVWGNEEDGFEVNDKYRDFTFECNDKDEHKIEEAFIEAAKENGYPKINKSKLTFEWLDENYCGVNDAKTGCYYFEITKED